MSYLKSFFFGILAAISALVLEQAAFIFAGNRLEAEIIFNLSWMLIISALVEEALKFLLIYKNSQDKISKYNIIISSLWLGAGFALTEIFLYSLGQKIVWQSDAWLLLGILFIHLVTSGYGGFLVSKKQNIYIITIRALLFNTILHILYNFAVLNIF